MSDDLKTVGVFDPVVQPFVDFWSDYVKQANDATREFLDGIDDTCEHQDLAAAMVRCRRARAWMRTCAVPSFLQAMKHNADAAIKAKRQIDDLATEIARNANIPTAGDISGLFERLHSVEEVILGRLGRIEDRLTGD